MGKLDGLHPYVKAKAEQLLEKANARLKHHKMIITHGYRSKAEQDKLYAQGRTAPGPIVTNAKGFQSMHNYGLAIDFALVTPDGKQAVWNTTADFDRDGKADWMEVVEEAKKLGFEWGGDWKNFKDNPHFQMTGNLTEAEVKAGKKPLFINKTVTYSLDKQPAKSSATYRLAKFVDTQDPKKVEELKKEGYLVIALPEGD